MKILIAPDKFKGSLTALEVCQAIARGLKANKPDLDITFHPMADGGDGSLSVLSNHLDLQTATLEVANPLGKKISVSYLHTADAAFIEVASASGLVLLSNAERNPMLTSTFGTGQMIADALARQCPHAYLLLGGSATNDAGMGIAHALGFHFLDKNKKPLEPIGGNLAHVRHIISSQNFDLKNTRFTLLCDVNNPLHGPNGAAHVYARQKGATEEDISALDFGLKNFASVVGKEFGINISDIPGGGAAGGIAGGLMGLFPAEIKSGFAAIGELTGLEQKIHSADWVISGEGRLDGQSLQGKVVSGVAALCKKHGKPLTLFAGGNLLSNGEIQALGATEVFAIADKANHLSDAIENGGKYLEKLASIWCQVLMTKDKI